MKYPILAVLTLSAFAFAQNPAPAPPAAPAAAPAPEYKAIAPAIDLAEGDTLVFLGDSITHQCLYTQYVEDYFYTRYPAKKLHFHNAGVGGDRAIDALRRFDDDVAAFKPKYVTILLGMNDGSYRGYDQGVFDTYQKDMTTVLEKIAGIGATAIPMTPTMHDARAQRMRNKAAEPRDTYYNSVLAFYGTWLREQAEQRGLGFVNMWGPLNDITLEQRKTNAKWTMIQDGVHPGAVGQTVMAVAVINDMVPRSQVSAVTVEQKDGKLAASAANGTVSDFAAEGTTIRFTLAANALPWVLPPDTAEGQKLTKLGHKYSNEKVTVRNIPAGKYELRIDGQAVGQYTDGELAGGVELQSNDKTPQYQQALKVATLNKERNGRVYQAIRGEYAQLKGRAGQMRKDEAANGPDLATKKADFDTYLAAMKEKVAKLVTEAKDIEKRIHEAATPVPHKYELVKI